MQAKRVAEVAAAALLACAVEAQAHGPLGPRGGSATAGAGPAFSAHGANRFVPSPYITHSVPSRVPAWSPPIGGYNPPLRAYPPVHVAPAPIGVVPRIYQTPRRVIVGAPIIQYATPPVVYYSNPPVTYVQPAPVVATPAVPAAPSQDARYFCPDYREFYPQVESCPSSWLIVLGELPQGQ